MHEDIQRKSSGLREQCKGPEAASCLECFRKEISVVGTEGVRRLRPPREWGQFML